jgi:hypothetical protein
MKKKDAWAILRIDEMSIELADYISIKGVYDSEEAAHLAIPSASEKSHYLVVRTRHYCDEIKTKNFTQSNHQSIQSIQSIQGIQLRSNGSYAAMGEFQEGFSAIQCLWQILPPQTRKQALLQSLNQLTEVAIARALSASLNGNPSLPWDLELSNGQRIAVKVVILEPEAKKSPNLQFPLERQFDFFVIVVFTPDLQIEIAKMIPVEALDFYARSVNPLSKQSALNLRVTQALLDYPGSQTVNLNPVLVAA